MFEFCWLWWFILFVLVFILGVIVGCLFCSNKKKFWELEVDNVVLQAWSINWEKDYMGLKYQYEQLEGIFKEICVKLNSCEVDKWILEFKLMQAGEGEGRVELLVGFMLVVGMGCLFNLDDFIKIEGIGLKIEGLFNVGGIYIWKELVNMIVEWLQEILDEVGKWFGLVKLDFWLWQAVLAEVGEWEVL